MYYFSLRDHDLFRVVSCCFVFTARELGSRGAKARAAGPPGLARSFAPASWSTAGRGSVLRALRVH